MISEQITLWSQAGSTVIRGNLIVVPVGDSLIYLQPVYLQSTGSAFPEFQRIVVASPREVVWGETLGDAPAPSAGRGGRVAYQRHRTRIARPDSADPGRDEPPSGSPGPAATPPSGDVEALIEYANLHFELAQAALRDGRLRPLRRGDRARRHGARSQLRPRRPGPRQPCAHDAGGGACGVAPRGPRPAGGVDRRARVVPGPRRDPARSSLPIVVTPSRRRDRERPGADHHDLRARRLSLGRRDGGTAIFVAFFGWLVDRRAGRRGHRGGLIEVVAAMTRRRPRPRPAPRPARRRRGRVWRIVLLRLVAFVPLALALALGSPGSCRSPTAS